MTADLSVARICADAATGLAIGGHWSAGSTGARFAVEDPATGATVAEVASASVADAQDAADASARAFASWRTVAPERRADLLWRAHDLMLEHSDVLADLIVLEMGKARREAVGEVLYSAAYLRCYAELAPHAGGRTGPGPGGSGRMITTRGPVGPCVAVTPWNYPLAMPARKLAPALAAGCTTTIKPAEQTPLSVIALQRILEAAGLPPGVVNVLPTADPDPVTRVLIADERTRKLSFTGSTAVGKLLAARAAERVLRVSLELGGNAPLIVFADADLDRAVEGALEAKLRNVGEACTAANRIYVERAAIDEFSDRLAARMEALKVGPGSDPEAELGPMIDAEQRARVVGLVDDAVSGGARVVCGGGALPGPGYFFAPTLLRDVPDDARVLHEEIFGPLAAVRPFDGEADAVAQANATEYGLVAFLFTSDVDRALRVADALETGMVALNQGRVSNANAPFGGVKASGYGREGGVEGLDDYLATKYLAVAVEPAPEAGIGATPE
jgi:succinate-semialdehyde dehydrogenase/glutarate-semialdehyde dehydrogenase